MWTVWTDPSFTPATGTAVPGGVTLRQSLELLSQIQAKSRVRGMDMVEVNPKLSDIPGQDSTLSCAGLVAQFLPLNETLLSIAEEKGQPEAEHLEPEEVTVGGNLCKDFDAETSRKIHNILEGVEKERKELVAHSVAYHEHIPFRAPLERLQPVEREVVRLLQERVKPILNHIEALQCQPQADAQREWMKKHGDDNCQGLFQRFHRDQMAGPWAYDERASLIPTFPDLPAMNGMISPDISLDEFKALAA